MKHDVIVIGAGAAGLYTANLLAGAGKKIALLEARDRLGGRILTLRSNLSTGPIELGAEFIHGLPPVTWNLFRQAGLRACDVKDSHLQLRNGKLVENRHFWDEIEKVMGRLPRTGSRDISFAAFLNRQTDLPSSMRKRARMFVEGFDAADTLSAGARGLAEAEKASAKIQGDRLFRPVNGYGALVDWLAARIAAQDIEMHLNCIVKRIEWSRSGCSVMAAVGEKPIALTARRAVITLPLGVLQHGDVEFAPTVPGLAQALVGLKMGPVIKVILQFENPFWEKIGGLESLGFMHGPGLPLPTWWTQLPIHDTTLTAWAGGPAASAITGAGEDHILDQAIKSLSKFFHVSPNQLRKRLTAGYVHDWPADPFARGAYSYVAVNGVSAAARFGKLGQGVLFFAGEHTHSGFSGTVAGALESAERTADQILH